MPSQVDGVGLSIHPVASVARALHLLDNLDFEAQASACREEARWEFQLVIAPRVLARGTASPVNPIAVF